MSGGWDNMTAQVTAEFVGGPADGRVEAVPRERDRAPHKVTFAGYDQKTHSVLRHYYSITADVGPAARYEFVRTEREPM